MYVCLWMCVYMYVYMYVCMCICMCIYVRICIGVYVYVCLCVTVCICVYYILLYNGLLLFRFICLFADLKVRTGLLNENEGNSCFIISLWIGILRSYIIYIYMSSDTSRATYLNKLQIVAIIYWPKNICVYTMML